MRSVRIAAVAVLADFAILQGTPAEEISIQRQAPACAPRADDGRLLWSGDFELGDLDQWQWDMITTFTTEVSGEPGPGSASLLFASRTSGEAPL